MKILIVDDDPVNLRAMNMLLTLSGYKTLEAATGKECLELARREKPDIILLDVMLPDRDGTEVSAEIKSDPSLEESYIILNLSEKNNPG